MTPAAASSADRGPRRSLAFPRSHRLKRRRLIRYLATKPTSALAESVRAASGGIPIGAKLSAQHVEADLDDHVVADHADHVPGEHVARLMRGIALDGLHHLGLAELLPGRAGHLLRQILVRSGRRWLARRWRRDI